MATLEDKILGEKAHCYCSSSESEDDMSEGEDNGKEASGRSQQTANAAPPPQAEPYKWEGSSTNTGPKGVMKDWQQFKQLEAERRVHQERERQELIKKLSLTCRSALDEEREKAAEDPDLAELLSDDFLLQYQQKRMKEMIAAQSSSLPKFGKLLNLRNGEEFLDAIDKEHKSITVIIHIFEENVPSCEAMNGCLITLSKEYMQVKFCKLNGSVAGVSRIFKVRGVPALLVYKSGSLVGNFVRLSNEFGHDFFAEDVENFLLEHGMLPDKTHFPSIIRSEDDDGDNSDLSLE